jgi:5-methylcytosine-specific restriction endonuclease McrA
MKAFSDILKESILTKNEITYGELLNSFEWIEKRENILKRDDNTCSKCNKKVIEIIDGLSYRKLTEKEKTEYLEQNKKEKAEMIEKVGFSFRFQDPNETLVPLTLQAHHKYYILNRLPWEYKNDALTTLCRECHQDIHNDKIIPVYKTDELKENLKFTPCERCNGSGYLNQYHYVQNGICFLCNGKRFKELIK